MKLLGAVLVILSGTCCGLNEARRLFQDCRRLSELRRALERMYSEVCLCRASLPEALATLRENYPSLFAGNGLPSGEREELSFRETWDRCVQEMGLPAAAEISGIRLGEALAAGEDPERTFFVTRRELEELQETLRTRQRERSRVYTALGVSGGVLAALLLL